MRGGGGGNRLFDCLWVTRDVLLYGLYLGPSIFLMCRQIKDSVWSPQEILRGRWSKRPIYPVWPDESSAHSLECGCDKRNECEKPGPSVLAVRPSLLPHLLEGYSYPSSQDAQPHR